MSVKSTKRQVQADKTFSAAIAALAPIVSSYSIVGTDDTALDPAGGQTILLKGVGFKPGATIMLGLEAISVVSYVDTNTLSFTSPVKSAGTYSIYVTNTDYGTGILTPGIIYSTFPTWTTASGSQGSYYETQSINNSFVATSDTAISSYTLDTGTLPPGSSLASNGVLTGTAPADSGSTTYTFTLKATDSELQDSTRSFSLTINTDIVTWSAPANGASYVLTGNQAMANVTLSATSVVGSNVTYAANALPTGTTLVSGVISGTPTVEESITTLLTATAVTTNRTATRTISWTVSLGDIYWKYVSLLLNGNTPTTTVINDASLNNSQLTNAGDTKPNNFNPYSEGYYSNYFDGTGDYLTLGGTPANFGTGDFLIEGWICMTGTGGGYPQFLSANGTTDMQFAFTSNTAIYFFPGGTSYSASQTFTLGIWYHVAWSRVSGTIKIFVNGVEKLSFSYPGAINLGTALIGAYAGGTANGFFQGYISNLRVLVGTGVTTIIVPTSPLTAIANTSLLTCQSNRLIDNSNNNLTITKNGDTKVSSGIPFATPTTAAYNTQYSTSFDGNGDYLTTAGSSLLGTNFTIEFFTFFNSFTSSDGNYQNLLGVLNANDAVGNFLFLGNYNGSSYTAGAMVLFNQNNNKMTLPGGTFVLNTWQHVALVRENGTALRMYVNGVQVGSSTTSAGEQWGASNVGYIVGTQGANIGRYFNGNISNLRVVNGTALYSSAFTPPTSPLTAIANTSLLTCQDATLKDNSMNNLVITSVGNAKPIAVSPFTMTTSSTTVTSLGSAYFDGTGDYLSIEPSPAFTFAADFTMEAWVYPTVINADNCIVSRWTSSLSFIFKVVSGGRPYIATYPNSVVTQGTTTEVKLNQWSHVAVVRTGSTVKLFVNGVQDATTGSHPGALNSSTTAITIGSLDTTPSQLWNGYLSNVRVINGTALYTSNFLPPQAPLTPVTNTQLLTLQYNGGANNNGFVDQSSFNNIITRTGNTTQGTFSPVSQNGWSNYFNGSADYLTVPAASTAFGTSAWTIECWIYLNSLSLACVIIDTRNSAAGNNGVQMSVLANGSLYWFEGSSSTIFGLSAGTITAGRWYHIAFVRANTSANGCTIYIDGVSKGNSTSNLSHAGYITYIGRNAAASQDYMNGYISNLRIVNGIAVYSGAFTPSTIPLAPITKTSILTCQSNRVIDNSPYSYAVTIAGTPSVQAFSPFGGVTSVPSSYSVYFDGTGDYLTVPASSAYALPADFTIELWFNVIGAGDNRYQHIFQSRDGTNNGFLIQYDRTNATIELTSDTGFTGAISANAAITDGVWYHFAAVRIGTSVKIYLNGTQVGTTVTSSQNLTATGTLYVSRRWVTDGALHYFNGYISNIRLVKGIGVYTGNFTVPTSPLATSQSSGTNIVAVTSPNTSLLTCQSSTLIDNSTNYAVITAFADSKPKSFNPFGNTATTSVSYSPSVISGSMYFDGTGDKLTVANYPSLSFKANDFTIQAWVYINAGGAEQVIMTNGWAAYCPWCIKLNISNQVLLNVSLNGGTWTISESVMGTVTVGQWFHVAVTRTSGVIRGFVNGIQGYTTDLTTNSLYDGSQALTIGGRSDTTSMLNGYITDAQLINGTSLYKANFVTPVTPATITNRTTLLLNGITGGIIDYHSSNDLETVGNTQLASEDPYGGSYYSNYFDGNINSYLTIPTVSSALNTPGDFTLELWMFVVVGPTDTNVYGNIYGNNAAANTHMLGLLSATYQTSAPYYLHMLISSDGGKIRSDTQIELGKWYHVAHTRTSGVNRIFINGVVQTQTFTESVNRTFGTSGAYISKNLGAYISNFRYVKGTSLYTTTFTPSTSPLTAIENTSVLTCQSNTFRDSSTWNLAVTRNGTTSIKSINPFQQNTGKSLYFDGTGDYIASPTSVDGRMTGDFTVECWVYKISAGTDAGYTNIYAMGNETSGRIALLVQNNTLMYGTYGTGNESLGGTVPYGVWTHIAFVRSGTTVSGWVNGVATGTTLTKSGTLGNALGFYIGALQGGTGAPLNGYIKDLRVTKGVARYTTAFTPPITPLQNK